MPVMTAEEAERGYNNRAAVPDHPLFVQQFEERSRVAIETLDPLRDLRYGPGARETLDLFIPAARSRGIFAFIHGGYWRTFDKSDHAFVAPPFVAAGYAVAVINYDLCPAVTITTIVGQVRRALAWLVRDGPRHGATAPLVIGGHSAGGHLAAMMFAADWAALGFPEAPFVGAVSLSGVHDLEPLLATTMNADLRLDRDEARQMSPVRLAPSARAPLLVAVGADETSEFLRQSQLIHDAWPRNRPADADGPLRISGRQHFSVVLDFADPESVLTKATFRLFPN